MGETAYTHMSIHRLCMSLHARVYICVHACVCVCVRARLHLYAHACMHVICACINGIHSHVHTHASIDSAYFSIGAYTHIDGERERGTRR